MNIVGNDPVLCGSVTRWVAYILHVWCFPIEFCCCWCRKVVFSGNKTAVSHSTGCYLSLWGNQQANDKICQQVSFEMRWISMLIVFVSYYLRFFFVFVIKSVFLFSLVSSDEWCGCCSYQLSVTEGFILLFTLVWWAEVFEFLMLWHVAVQSVFGGYGGYGGSGECSSWQDHWVQPARCGGAGDQGKDLL